MNAGSTSANAGGSSAAAFSYAGGTFVRATGVFTVAGGANPLTDGVAVGTYGSVYTTAGAVAATFVAQITARDATTITVDVTTLKWGVATSVSEAAAATTLKVSGAWASEVVLAATGLGTFTVPVSTKINFTGNLTVAASRTISMAGATAAPLWFSGYNTTPGDLDNDTTNALTKPIWTFNSTFVLTTSGVYQLWSGVSVVGSRSGQMWSMSANPIRLSRCRVENTSSNAAAYAVNPQQGGFVAAYCWFKAPTTATSGIVTTGNAGCKFIGCVTEGGGLAGIDMAGNGNVAIQTISLNCAGAGFLASTAAATLHGCTVYNSTSDGVKWSGTPAAGATVIGCLFNICGGYGINASAGTTNNVFRACNDFYSCTSNPENGFGDSPAFFQQTDTGTGAPGMVVSATNMTPRPGSNARRHGFPGKFENEAFSGFVDSGAVQHQDSSGFFIP